MKEVENAMSELRKAVNSDPEYAWSWQCNLAMAAYDEGLDHAAANRSASRFMYNLFGLDITKHEHYSATQNT